MTKAGKKQRSRQVKVPSYQGRRRVLITLMLVTFSLLTWRSFERQIIETDFLQDQGERRFLREARIPANRGVITDRQGEILAISTPMPSVVADPQMLTPDRKTIGRLAQALQVDPDRLRRRLSRHREQDSRFVYLRRRVTPMMAEQIKQLDLDGIKLEQEYMRFYPSGEVSAHMVGFTNIDDQGQEGMELAYEQWLRAEPGSKRVIKDGRGRVIKDVESVRIPQPGKPLALSLDRRLQFLAYRELKATVEKHQARSGSAVILDVETGEVLAMVNRPSYNPNGSRSGSFGNYRNRSLIDVFEPGSTIKPFVVAAALEAGALKRDEVIDTGPGYFRVGRNQVRDKHDYGSIDVATVISKSSNVGASKIALRLEAEQLWQLFRDLGFGEMTESQFPGEAAGQLPHFTGWSKFEQATMAYGYGLSVTTLQLARAYSVLAADGVRYPVSLLRVDERPQGEPIIRSHNARMVRRMLEDVVASDGTAPQAAVAGYRVAGKTGTAKKSIAGGYADDRYIAAFVGMIPASRPRLVMAVMIDEPSAGQFYGGQVAAPLFAKVMAGAMRLLNVAPDQPLPAGTKLAQGGGQI